MEDLSTELYKSLRESQNKYIYFLLAAAGAMIGIAVQQTTNAVLDKSQLALAVAVLCWGLSFFFGCRHIAYTNASIYTNIDILRAEKGIHPKLKGKSVEHIKAAIEGMSDAFSYNSDKANSFAQWQFKFLIIGAVCYLFWHILQMYSRSLLN